VELYKFPPMLGPCEEYQEGTADWALRLGSRIQAQVRDIGYYGVDTVRKSVKMAVEAIPPPWEVWPVPPCGSVDAFFQLCCGKRFDQLYALIDAFHEDHELARKLAGTRGRVDGERISQGTRTDRFEHRSHTTKFNDRGAGYLLRRLARSHPDVLSAYERGKYPSVRAAAKAAGIIKEHTWLEKIRALWQTGSYEDQTAFQHDINGSNLDVMVSRWNAASAVEKDLFMLKFRLAYIRQDRGPGGAVIPFPTQDKLL
jgi:hypothetical protein